MKIEDLIDALAEEITSVMPQLDQHLDQLAVLELDDSQFADALDLYTSQIQRMGEAADMVGFSGLLAVAEQLGENAQQLAAKKPKERDEVIKFLRGWPDLMVHYLQNLDDPSVAAGLVDSLHHAPLPMSESDCMRVMHKLASLPLQMDMEDEASGRPVLAASDDVLLDIPSDVEPRLMDSFLQEAPEQVTQLVALIGNITSQNPADMGDLAAAKRAVHTLKGTGAIIGINGLANLGHHFEDILEYFEKQEGDVPEAVNGVLIDTAYCFEQIVAFIGGQDEFPSQIQGVLQDVLDLANRIDRNEDLSVAIRRGQMVAAATTAAVPQPKQDMAKRGGASSALRIDLDRIDELFRVSAEVSVHTAAIEEQIKQLSDSSKALLTQHLKVKKRLYELETVVDVRTISMMRSMGKGHQSASFDPLEMDQYNELHSTAHAMVEDANDAIELGTLVEDKIAQLSALQTKQQNLSRDLQHLVIGTRMAEVGTLEPRLQRNIRTTCQTTGKQAVLSLAGEDTLIDSDVLSHLSEPLLHLLRNAIDHGLESPTERLEAGKDVTGSIHLDFSKQGQQVVMRCQDDGRGLNYDSIRQRGLDKGLINETQDVSDEELAQLILLPSFSTKESVSKVSGRGVGLDVVNEWANRMNGEVVIRSVTGEGTTIELRFAASLSTAQVLIVEASEQSFALSSIQIEQALARGVGEFVLVDDTLEYHYNEKIVAGRFLSDLVGLPRDEKIALEDFSAVIIKIRGEQYALAVEKLIDSRELLIKDPGPYIRHIPAVAGMSILGDGSVTAHLDLSQLVGSEHMTEMRSAFPGFGAERSTRKSDAPKVLIVDDSLSVRNVLQELVGDLGFVTKTALDGVNAIEVLEDFKPDLVLTDLEMPNMNGVELTTHIRGRNDIAKVPIIMITSRSQAKHRELAEKAGVDEYVTKPYNEATLIQHINQRIDS